MVFRLFLDFANSYQFLLILPVGRRSVLRPLSSAYRVFRVSLARWHSKWNSNQNAAETTASTSPCCVDEASVARIGTTAADLSGVMMVS